MKTKTLTIRDDQQEWVMKYSINLSRFVQKRLDEAMGAEHDCT
jgi:hypothetical protein